MTTTTALTEDADYTSCRYYLLSVIAGCLYKSLSVTGLLAHATPAGMRAASTCIYPLSIGAEILFCTMEASSRIADRPTQNAEAIFNSDPQGVLVP